jgi:DnaJ domain
MSQPEKNKDYYRILDVDKDASQAEIDRQYKRQATKNHPDLGGSEERMKSLNEAYGVLKDQASRTSYDSTRRQTSANPSFVPASAPTARDIGVFGHCLSALLCLSAGMFLLLLVRFQWFWFLWPLAILALFVIGLGVLMARSAMVAVNASLPATNRLRRHTVLQELAFWVAIITGGYGLYLLMASY